MAEALQIGILVFPKVTQLDFTGPLQVFAGLPGATIHLIWKRIEPVPSDSVLVLTPTVGFADCPQLDVICVPGGMGTDDLVNDEETLAFLRAQARSAKYITSVCTERPFLSYGSSTLNGRFRTSAPGAYVPAVSYSGAAANRGSRDCGPNRHDGFPPP